MDTAKEVLEHKYQRVDIHGIPALFSDYRIKQELLPEGVKKYDIRHSDEGFDPCQIGEFIWVNHYGTILTVGEINPEILNKNNGEFECEDETEWMEYSEYITLEEYLKNNA